MPSELGVSGRHPNRNVWDKIESDLTPLLGKRGLLRSGNTLTGTVPSGPRGRELHDHDGSQRGGTACTGRVDELRMSFPLAEARATC